MHFTGAQWDYSTKWTVSVSVSAVCVIAWCIPSEEGIAVPAYTDTATPIIGDPGCLLSCRPLRSDVPGLILQGTGYCQSRSTAVYPPVDIYFRLLVAFRFHFSQTEFIGWYSTSCWNSMMRTINDNFFSNDVLLYDDVPLAIQLDPL